MHDVAVVEVGHEEEAGEGEEEGRALLVVGVPLLLVEVRPDHVVDLQRQQEREVRRGEVQDEALLVDGCAGTTC